MRIAQIAPLAESCPPRLYGGTERIVSFLTEELVAQGHDVTLFASGDTRTTAHLVPCSRQALRLDPAVRDHLPYHVAMLEEVRRRTDDFDVLHFHIDFLHFPMSRDFVSRTITTLHGRLDLPDIHPLFETFADVPLCSISHAQRAPMPACVNWVGNIHHGLPRGLLPFSAVPRGDYLVFIGRISPEKRPDRAIEIATRVGMPLIMAAKVDRVDQAYWEQVISPMVRASRHVEYIGEVDDQRKAELIGNAKALLFPIDWPEPFGLVMIEAMACGTPVVAFRCGSVPEVLSDGVSGVIIDSMDDAEAGVQAALTLDRSAVRLEFEARFTAERMAANYVQLYHQLAGLRSEAAHAHRANDAGLGLHVVA
ncbi:glycosyltransferase family 4 protein [Ancylobacter oerskovii]|uniref:Glycosyltransferase family 4 protein n=1 Tax=Ancylobacter oerskovii TaxID=459519 RepID=A0ABW4YVM4_9HYPH|nr:glycosyltransferase family 4 protein [Ancylobacter oerskovii]MBS7544317.1 glycosyltransferase family 4 protein [Ancylobacter oerskovii]